MPIKFLCVALIAVLATWGGTAAGDILSKRGSFGGLDVAYRVIVPKNFDSTHAYPTVLHFTGGPQTMDIVERSLKADWQRNAEARGYIVISPASPNGELFSEGADRIFPAFIEHILHEYPVQGGKLHVTGHSNGGVSAFHVASLYPKYFISLTGYPGQLNDATEELIDALRPLCIYMHVGERDTSWRESMQREADGLRSRGLKVSFIIEKNQVHRLDTQLDNLADRIFDELEASTRGCKP